MSPSAREYAIWVVWGGAMLPLALLYMSIPPSPDQSQFDWMAFSAIQGLPYYAGSFDMNWPGAMWLHEAGIRLFGVHAWTWRLTDFLLLMGFALAGAAFLKRAGWPLASVLFLWLYPPLYVTSGGWMAGQRDIISAGFLLVSCALALPGSRREKTACFIAGTCGAAAVLIRPTYLSFLAGLILLEMLPKGLFAPRGPNRLGRATWFFLGFAALLGLAVLCGWALGNLDDWYQQSIEFSLSTYVGDPPQVWTETLSTLFLWSWHWVTALGLVGLVLWLARDGFTYPLILILGILATVTVSFFFQNKFFGYHMGGALMVMALLAGIAFDGLAQQRRKMQASLRRQAVTSALLLAVCLAVAGMAGKLLNLQSGLTLLLAGTFGPQPGYGLTEQERRTIIAMIQDGSTGQDTVAVYGTKYDLAYRAQRAPTYRFFTPAADQISPAFEHHDAWLTEIRTALRDTPPAFVIMAKNGAAAAPSGSGAPGGSIRALLEAHVSQGHRVVFTNDALTVYKAEVP